MRKLKLFALYQSQKIKTYFSRVKAAGIRSIVSWIVLIQYNPTYDRRIAALSRAQICLYFLGLVLACLLTGCASRNFHVGVDSICSSAAQEKKRYILLPGNKEGNIDDLQFQEFAVYTDRALQAQGFTKATDINDAEIEILLCYGISEPEYYQYTYSEPVYGQTGVSSQQTAGSVRTYGNSTTYSESTSYTPRYGVIGSTTHIGTAVRFEKHLHLIGYDLEGHKRSISKTDDLKEIWSTKAISVGESGDLREVFPILLVASQKHIGKNTLKQVSCTLKDNKKLAKRIEELRS